MKELLFYISSKLVVPCILTIIFGSFVMLGCLKTHPDFVFIWLGLFVFTIFVIVGAEKYDKNKENSNHIK